MPKPGVIYRLNWQSFHETEDVQCFIDVSDNDNLIPDDDDADIRDLIPTETLKLSVIDNDDSPFKSIRAKQFTFGFANTTIYNFATFATGSDQRWSVHYYIGDDTKTVFKGFLVMDDLSEPLLPPGNEVIMTATDNLGLLKDIRLTNSDDDNPRGMYRIIDLLSMALSKTGLNLDFRISFNIKLNGDIDDISTPNDTDEHLFSRVYLNAKTFEDEIGNCIDCYQVIEKILGFEATLFQMKGQWWILRTDEVEDASRGLYISSFQSDGTFVENLGEKTFVKEIGIDKAIQLANEATEVRATRPYKEVRLDYSYENPKEIPDNVELTRGTVLDSSNPLAIKYNIESWIPLKEADGSFVTGVYILKEFNSSNYQTSNRLVFDSAATWRYIISTKIPVHQGDKFIIGFQRRLSSDVGGSGSFTENHAQVRLYADDGTFYTAAPKQPGSDFRYWESCNSSFTTNQHYFVVHGDASEDLTQEKTLFDGETAECPKDGYIRILIYQSPAQGATKDTYINDFSFQYLPYINGSHREYSGQYHKTNQDGNYKAKVQEDVFVSDAPKRLLKGALQKISSWYTVHSGSVVFNSGNSFEITGTKLLDYEPGQILRISTTTSNNITTRVTDVTYHVITNTTEVTVEDATVSETDASTLIESPLFVLANEFYNAAVFPSGPPDSTYVHPYGEIQLFDVWNQYKNEMRVLDADIEGLDLDLLDSDSLPDTADIINKYSFTDVDLNLMDRYFIKLSYDQNHDLAEETSVFREVVNLTKNKDYSNHEFKYKE